MIPRPSSYERGTSCGWCFQCGLRAEVGKSSPRSAWSWLGPGLAGGRGGEGGGGLGQARGLAGLPGLVSLSLGSCGHCMVVNWEGLWRDGVRLSLMG